MEIDLHGYHIHIGWEVFRSEVEKAYLRGDKSVTVITGQGAMMREFPIWCTNHSRIRTFNQHKHNPGSWSVKLKKVRKKG